MHLGNKAVWLVSETEYGGDKRLINEKNDSWLNPEYPNDSINPIKNSPNKNFKDLKKSPKNSAQLALLFNQAGKILQFNQAVLDFTGYSKRELAKIDIMNIIENEFQQEIRYISGEDSTMKPIVEKAQLNKKNQLKTPFSLKISKIDNDNYIGYDIKEFSTTSDTELAQHILEPITDFIVIIDCNGKIIYVNEAGLKLLGYKAEELSGTSVWQIFDNVSNDLRVNPDLLNNSVAYHLFTHKNGTKIPIRCHHICHSWNENIAIWLYGIQLAPLHLLSSQGDKIIQRQQRLMAVGATASGVAHEINNPLTGIINYAELIREKIKDDQIRDYADSIITEGQRIGNIVQNLLAFSRQRNEKFQAASVKDIIDSSLSLLSSVFRKSYIKVNIFVAENVSCLYCKPQQIEQVFINLLVNARNALNKRYKSFDENKIINIHVKSARRNKKSYVMIIFEDHGIGIPPKNMNRIFLPWFTTCESESSTGLGLPVSLSIVKAHKGLMNVESEAESHTRFIIYLPVKPSSS